MSATIFHQQRHKLEYFFQHLNYDKINALGDILSAIPSTSNIFIFGVGKSENISHHFATLLNSVGIGAFAPSVLNCLHGDIGLIDETDWLILISNSGNTRELLEIAPYLEKKTTHIIGIFANPNARLLSYCSHHLILPRMEEIGIFNHIPTTSVLAYIALINVLTIYLVEKKSISLETYANNHPNGHIGDRIYRRVKDIMLSVEDIPLVNVEMTIQDCFFRICEKRLRCAMVLNPDRTIMGIVSDGDIRRHLSNYDAGLSDKVAICLNMNPFVVNQLDKITDVIEEIKDDYRLLSGIPVIDDNRQLVGLISQHQIVDYGL